MSSGWSGLAPAVNAHLARWVKVRDEMERLGRLADNDDGREIVMAQWPVTSAWAIFARSWGLPQEDGTIVVPRQVTEHSTINGREQFEDSRATVHNGIELMAREHIMLQNSTSVYVGGNVVQRVLHAAMQAEPEPLFPTDLFTMSGFAVLEQPLLVPDYHPDTGELVDYLDNAVRAVGWYPCPVHAMEDGEFKPGPGIMMFGYTTHHDWVNTYGKSFLKAVDDDKIVLDESQQEQLEDNKLHGKAALIPPRFFDGQARDGLIPLDVMPWRFGTPWYVGERPEYEPHKIDSAVAYVRRFMLSLMRFTWQDLVRAERAEPSKKLSWRMDLAKRPVRDITVLRLRRVRDSGEKDETGTGIPLQHRVKVIAHWRRQHYPSLGPAYIDGEWNPESHRLVWIDEHWRGPEDGPIGALQHGVVIVR